MRQIRMGWVIAGFALLVSSVIACGPSQEEQMAAAAAEKYDALVEMQSALNAKRDEMAAARAAAEAEEPAEGEGEGEGETMEGDGPDLDAMEEEVENMTNDFITAIVDFINSDPPIEGEPLSETQLAAIRMKSAEDMMLAEEYIEKGGDYRRAIRIYTDALSVDPDNEELQAGLAAAEENRFTSPERFAEAKKGMSQDEIRELLGPVNLRNIREYDRGVVAWFYPTADDGAAAGVFFRKRGDTYRAYDLKYEAVKAGAGE